jgi:hypothetical protein
LHFNPNRFLADAPPVVRSFFFSSQSVSCFADAHPVLDPRLTRYAIDAGHLTLPRLPSGQFAEKIIADCDGDPRAAVNDLVAIVGALLEKNKAPPAE